MKILLTGVTGYIAQRLLPVLLEEGHQVVCCVRDKHRFRYDKFVSDNLRVIEVDFLIPETLHQIPNDIDVAYYLIHSMSAGGDFTAKEEAAAINFRERMRFTCVRQVIYLSGIINSPQLSQHLTSRKNVGQILSQSTYALTNLRAGIIVGSGSASFEIMRDLVEKLPVMIAPKWLNTRCQPIAIRNVIEFLVGVLGRTETYNKDYDIGGPDILTYKEMLLRFAKLRGLNRRIRVVPVMTPRLSSYWLYFITSTSWPLARNLVESLKNEMVCRKNDLATMLNISLIDYETSIKLAFDKIEQNAVLSSWKDAFASGRLRTTIARSLEVPTNGCFKDARSTHIDNVSKTLKKIWSIGGKTGWYYGNWLWEIRGIIDQVFKGVGLRRGRRSASDIFPGEALDFWRVLLADKEKKRLLLYAEMKLPGEAWLEFSIDDNNVLTQTATFRPLGLLGRLYWLSMLPFHELLFKGMLRRISS